MNAAGALAVMVPLALGASFALAQKVECPAIDPAPPGAAAPSRGAGLVVFVDPATGQIRQPDAAEIGSLLAVPPPSESAAPRADKPLVMTFGPGGAVGVVLDERFESFMVVTKAPDGKLAVGCVEGRKKADAAVAAKGKEDAR
jgi:hypothetical protein